MSTEANKQLVQRTFAQLFNQGELALAGEVVSDDYLSHDAPPQAPRGPAGLRHMVTLLRTAFPDIHYQTEELIAEEDVVVARTTMSGTHLGEFFGTAPTGRQVRQDQIHILRFANGKVVEHLAVRDDLAMLQQLGVLPPVWGNGHEKEVEQ